MFQSKVVHHTKNQEDRNLNVKKQSINTRIIQTLELPDKEFKAHIISTLHGESETHLKQMQHGKSQQREDVKNQMKTSELKLKIQWMAPTVEGTEEKPVTWKTARQK